MKPLEPDPTENRVNGLELALEAASGRTDGVEITEHDQVRVTDLPHPVLDPPRKLPVLSPAVREILRSRFQVYDHQSNFPLGIVPLLLLDMWEHAFYLQYKNVKVDFAKAFWNVVNWADVQDRYAAATSKTQGLIAG